MNKLPNTDGKNLAKLLESEGIEKYKAAERLQKEVDYALCSAGLIQAMKMGDATYQQSLQPQKNTIYETNLLTSKGHKVFVDKSGSKDNSATSRSKYLWSEKSSDTYVRLQTVPVLSDAKIGSDFEFMMKLHHMLAVNTNIGVVDCIYMVPSLDDVVGTTTASADSGPPNHVTRAKKRLETEATVTAATQVDIENGTGNQIKEPHNSTFAGIVREVTARRNEGASSADDHFIRLFSHFKFTTNSFALSKEEFLRSSAEDVVYDLINDYEPLLHNGHYNPTEVTGIPVDTTVISRPHPGKFPTRGILRAVLAEPARQGLQDSVYIRPLLTSGDVLLAMHELLDRSLFKCGCITIPHALRGPMLTDHRGGCFYRCVFRLNKPIAIYHLTPKLSVLAEVAAANRKETKSGIPQAENNNADLRSFLCPRYHKHCFNFEHVGDSSELDGGPAQTQAGELSGDISGVDVSSVVPGDSAPCAASKTPSRQDRMRSTVGLSPTGSPRSASVATGALVDPNPAAGSKEGVRRGLRPEEKADLVRQCRLIVESLTATYGMGCLLMHLVLDFDSCIELPEVACKKHPAHQSVHLPTAEAGRVPKLRELTPRDNFRKHFRLSQLSHAEFQHRVAPQRRAAVAHFTDEEKTYMKLFHAQVHAEYSARKGAIDPQKLAGAEPGHAPPGALSRDMAGRVGDAVYDRVFLEAQRLAGRTHKLPDCAAVDTDDESEPEPLDVVPEEPVEETPEQTAARLAAERSERLRAEEERNVQLLRKYRADEVAKWKARQAQEALEAEQARQLQLQKEIAEKQAAEAERARLAALPPAVAKESVVKPCPEELARAAEIEAQINSPQPNQEGGIATYDAFIPPEDACELERERQELVLAREREFERDSDEAFSAAVAARKQQVAGDAFKPNSVAFAAVSRAPTGRSSPLSLQKKGKGKKKRSGGVERGDEELEALPPPSERAVTAVGALTQTVVDKAAVAAIRSHSALSKQERARLREEQARERKMKEDWWERQEQLQGGAGSRAHSATGARRPSSTTEVVRLPIMGSAAPRTSSRESNTASNGIAPVAVGLSPAEVAARKPAPPPGSRTIYIPTASQDQSEFGLAYEDGEIFYGANSGPGVAMSIDRTARTRIGVSATAGSSTDMGMGDVAIGEAFINSSVEMAISEAESHLNLNIRKTAAMKEKKRAQRRAASYKEAMVHAMEDFLQQFVRREADAHAHLLATAQGAGQGETATSLFQRNRDVIFYTAVAAATNDISRAFNPQAPAVPPTDPSVFPLAQYYRNQYQHGGCAQLSVDVMHQTKGPLTYQVHLPSRSMPVYRPALDVDPELAGVGSSLPRAFDFGSLASDRVNKTPLTSSHIDAFRSHYDQERDLYLEAEDEKMREIERAYENRVQLEQRSSSSPKTRSPSSRSRAASCDSAGESPSKSAFFPESPSGTGGGRKSARMRAHSENSDGSAALSFVPLGSSSASAAGAAAPTPTAAAAREESPSPSGGGSSERRRGTECSPPTHAAVSNLGRPLLEPRVDAPDSQATGERERQIEETSALLKEISTSDLFRQPNMKAFLQELLRLSANSNRSGANLKKKFAAARANLAASAEADAGAYPGSNPLDSQFSSMVDNWSLSLGDDASSFGADFSASAELVYRRREEAASTTDEREHYKQECDSMLDRMLDAFPDELAAMVRTGLKKRATRLAHLQRMKQKKIAGRRKQERKLPKVQVLIDAITGGALENSSMEYASASVEISPAGAPPVALGAEGLVSLPRGAGLEDSGPVGEEFPTLEHYLTGVQTDENGNVLSSSQLDADAEGRRDGSYFDGFDDDISSESDDETFTSDMRRAHDEFLQLQSHRAGGRLWGEEQNVFSFQMKTARPSSNVINPVQPRREGGGADGSSGVGYTVISYLEKTKEEYRQLYDQMEGLIVSQRRDHEDDQRLLHQQARDQHSERLSAIAQGLDSHGGVMDLHGLPSIYINQAAPVGSGSVFSFGDGLSVEGSVVTDPPADGTVRPPSSAPRATSSQAPASASGPADGAIVGAGDDELRMLSEVSGDAAQHAQELAATKAFTAAYGSGGITVQDQFRRQELESDERNAAIATNYLNSTRAQAKRARQEEREREWRERAQAEAEAKYRLVVHNLVPSEPGSLEACLDLGKLVPPADAFSADLLSELLYRSDDEDGAVRLIGRARQGSEDREVAMPASGIQASVGEMSAQKSPFKNSPLRAASPREKGRPVRGSVTSSMSVGDGSTALPPRDAPGGSNVITLAELLQVINSAGPESERCQVVGVRVGVGEGAFDAADSGILSPGRGLGMGSAFGATIGYSSINEDSASGRECYSSPQPATVRRKPGYDAHPTPLIDHAAGFASDEEAEARMEASRRAIRGSTRAGSSRVQRMRAATTNKTPISFNRARTGSPGKPSTAPAVGPESPREGMRAAHKQRAQRPGSTRERARSPGGPGPHTQTRMMSVLIAAPDSTDIVVKGSAMEGSLVESPGQVHAHEASSTGAAVGDETSPVPVRERPAGKPNSTMIPLLFYETAGGVKPVRLELGTSPKPVAPTEIKRSATRPARNASSSPGRVHGGSAGAGGPYRREYVREDLLSVRSVSPPSSAQARRAASSYDLDVMMDSYDRESAASPLQEGSAATKDSASVRFVFMEPGEGAMERGSAAALPGQGPETDEAAGARDNQNEDDEELTVISQPVVVVSTVSRGRSNSNSSDISMGGSIASGGTGQRERAGSGFGGSRLSPSLGQVDEQQGRQAPEEGGGLVTGAELEGVDESESEVPAQSASVDYTRQSVTSPPYSYQVSVVAPVETLLQTQPPARSAGAGSPGRAVPVLISPRLDQLGGTDLWAPPVDSDDHPEECTAPPASHHFLGHLGVGPDTRAGRTAAVRGPAAPQGRRAERPAGVDGEPPVASQVDQYLLGAPPVQLLPAAEAARGRRPRTGGAPGLARALGSRAASATRALKHGLALVPGAAASHGDYGPRTGRSQKHSKDGAADGDGPAALVQPVRRPPSQVQEPLCLPQAMFQHSVDHGMYQSMATDASPVPDRDFDRSGSRAVSAEPSGAFESGEIPPLPQLEKVARSALAGSVAQAAAAENLFSLDLNLGSLSLESASFCLDGELSGPPGPESQPGKGVPGSGAKRVVHTGSPTGAAAAGEVFRVSLSSSRPSSRNASPTNAGRKQFEFLHLDRAYDSDGPRATALSGEPSVCAPASPIGADALVYRVNMSALDLMVDAAAYTVAVSPPRPRPQPISALRESSMLSETSASAKASSLRPPSEFSSSLVRSTHSDGSTPAPVSAPAPGTVKESIEIARERIPHILPFRHPQHPQSVIYDSRQNVLQQVARRPTSMQGKADKMQLEINKLAYAATLKTGPRVGNKAPLRAERMHVSLQKTRPQQAAATAGGVPGRVEGVPSEFVLNSTGAGTTRRAVTAGSTRRTTNVNANAKPNVHADGYRLVFTAAPAPHSLAGTAPGDVEASLSVQRALTSPRNADNGGVSDAGSGLLEGEPSQVTEFSALLSGNGDCDCDCDGDGDGDDKFVPTGASTSASVQEDEDARPAAFDDDDLSFDQTKLQLGFVPRAPLGSQRPSAGAAAPRVGALLSGNEPKSDFRTSPIQTRGAGLGVVGNTKKLSGGDGQLQPPSAASPAGPESRPGGRPEKISSAGKRPVSAYAKLARVPLQGMVASAGVAGSNISLASPAPPSAIGSVAETAE